jgi:mono/diheme cytochrome c family protein
VNSTVTTFEHKGKQYVVVHAGGGVFANGKQGDGIWMFSLDGKMESLAPPAPTGPGSGGPPAGPPPARAANVENGEKLYKAACLPCHGETAAGGHGGGPTLVGGMTHSNFVAVTTTGKNNMPSFSATYSAQQIEDIAGYVLGVLAKKK